MSVPMQGSGIQCSTHQVGAIASSTHETRVGKRVEGHFEHTPHIHPLYTPYSPPIHPLYTPYSPPIHPVYSPYTPPMHPLHIPYTTPMHPPYDPYIPFGRALSGAVSAEENV